MARYEEIKKNQSILVYHATDFDSVIEMINGFDALEVRKRRYESFDYKHRGLFVAPTPNKNFGSVVLEIETQAKFLHGTDWSGNIGRHKNMNWIHDNQHYITKYPKSFRPTLTESLNRSREPQALLLGLVKARQIKRICYMNKWYSREEFVEKKLKNSKIYIKEKLINDLNVDLTYLNYSLHEVIQVLAILGETDVGSMKRRFKRTENWDFERQYKYISQTFKFLGFKGSATDKYTRMIISNLKSL